MKIDAIYINYRAALLFTAETQDDWLELERIVRDIYDADIDVAEYDAAIRLLETERQLKIEIHYSPPEEE